MKNCNHFVMWFAYILPFFARRAVVFNFLEANL
jgi:hypothetical protein